MFSTIFRITIFVLITAVAVGAQTTAFTYQGNLTDGGTPANGSFQMQFKLFDALSGGTQIGSTLANVPVTVSAGSFSTRLDFGAPALSGANRWLEIAVRRTAAESYITLAPREQIASSPYAVRTLSAAVADDSQKLGGINAAEYLTSTNANGSFIRNSSTPQTATFNISGNGLIGGQVGINTPINPNYHLDIFGGARTHSTSAAHFVAETIGGTNSWARFYMRSPERSWFMGTSRAFNGNQLYIADETAGQIRMAISTGGFVGIGTSNPQVGLEVSGTGAATQQRITDTASGNSLVLQSGTGSNMKLTGYNYGSSTGVPLYISVDGADTILNSSGGDVGIGTAFPNAKLSVAGNISQSSGSFGIPKAMVFVNANGTIARCYNGLSSLTTGGCGFSVTGPFGGTYLVNFGFNVSTRFYSLTSSSIWLPGVAALTGRLGFDGSTPNVVNASFWKTNDLAATPSDFTLIVY